ncbi:amino acid ABC transporter substrate-binding protein [Nocardioides anomalus]|uniref:Amino acid ABC transporter substrate-binding protein n=1 Tax=Nocardioides anomalus TaxID=2712223 RepID=A0A6G6WIP4_9ACTN|nr:ABC transporter substrate-binding protein [Nocardioides anomalus]QIG45114.1 amino acid ABC transporter substrate-binding protein [Nocardioides anomalus]
MRLRTGLAVLPLVLVPLACAPADDSSGSSAGDDETTADASPTLADSETLSVSPAPTEAGGISPECAPDQLNLKEAGTLTVGTDKPAYEPWFSDNDPSNGKGYESAVAYAVADALGVGVTWTVVPFNTSYKPGDKDFDFDINQISITPEREQVVDFSDGYYAAAQAVIALKDSDIASATSVADLASYKLGAQTGTTSLTAIRETIKADDEPLVFEDTNAAKQALVNGQVDGIVADLPTAFYITAAEIKNSVIVGQFQPISGEQEEFGMLFQKGNPLVSCVNEALAQLKADGTLDQLQQEWLSNQVDVPVLQ